MGLQIFISLLSVLNGLIGSIFLAKSFIALTPSQILHLTSPYSRIAFAPEQIASMSIQKSDSIVGIFFIIIAFICQISALVLVKQETVFLPSRWMGFWVAVMIISSMTVVVSYVGLRLAQHIKIETGKEALKDYCQARITRDKFDPVDVSSMITMAEQLGLVIRETQETDDSCAERIFGIVGFKSPNLRGIK